MKGWKLRENNSVRENDTKMPLQELVRKWEVGRSIITLVERKSHLHGKRVSNNNLIIIKLISTYIKSERSVGNEDQQFGD